MITVNETWANGRDFPLSGKYIKILACANPVDIYLSKEGALSDQALQVTAGFHATIDFEKVRVVAAGGGDTVKFIVSDGEAGIDASIVTLGAPISVTKPATISTVADVVMGAGAATQILPADSTRRSALISNLAANANIMRIGDANVGAARGTELSPGQTETLEGTQAIFGYSVGAQSVGVTVIQD